MATSNIDGGKAKKEDLFLSFFDAWNDYKRGQTTAEELKELLINQAILNAYDDATRQGAFNSGFYKICGFYDCKLEYIKRIPKEKKKKIENMSPEKKMKEEESAAKEIFKNDKYPDNIKDEAINLIRGKIGIILCSPYEIDYKDWHKNLCGTINNDDKAEPKNSLMYIFKKNNLDKAFTVGNAQKWVNMTMKYLYVYATFLDEMNEFCKNNPFQGVLDLREKLDVPLDRIILKAVFNKDGRKSVKAKGLLDDYADDCDYVDNYGEINFTALRLKGNYKDKDGKTKWPVWSKIDNYEDYRTIQEELKLCIPKNDRKLPLEWENKVWLAASRE